LRQKKQHVAFSARFFVASDTWIYHHFVLQRSCGKEITMGTEFDPTNLIVIAACILLFVVQLLLCVLSRRVFVRLIPTVLAILCAGISFAMVFLSSGWDAIGYLLLAIVACFPLAACVFAWAIFFVIWIIKKIAQRD
jgi:hypothetical protein